MFTSTSMRPKRSMHPSTAEAMLPSSDRSILRGSTLSPPSAWTSERRDTSLAVAATVSPRASAALAMPSPRPLEQPVTNHVTTVSPTGRAVRVARTPFDRIGCAVRERSGFKNAHGRCTSETYGR